MHKPFRGIKLTYIVSFIVLFAMITTFIVSTWSSYKAQKQSIVNNMLELNKINAEKLSNTADSLFKSMKNNLALSVDVLKRLPNDEERQLYLDTFRTSNNYFNSLLLVDANGTVTLSSPSNIIKEVPKVLTPVAVKAIESKQAIVSEAFTTSTNRLVVFISQPVFKDNGDYIGMLGGIIYLHDSNVFQQIYGDNEISENGSYFFAVDPKGQIIYSPFPERTGEFVGNINPVVHKLMNGESGQQALINSKGVPFLAGFSIAQESKWGFVSQTPEANVNIASSKLIKDMMASTVPLMLFLILIVLWISKKLSDPLTRLSEYALLFDHETAPTAPPLIHHWNYEANALNRTILRVVSLLQNRVATFEQEAQTDPLTGLGNRRMIDDHMQQWLKLQMPFSIIMLDLDHFKAINDEFGHPKGDEVLQFLAQVIQKEVRSGDVCCRLGGEEFMILQPYATEEHAHRIAERIRHTMNQTLSPVGRSVTLSLGIASYPSCAVDKDTLIQIADNALYEAKRRGRNQTVSHSQIH